MRIANYVAAGLFALSVGLQHNDPDPLAWMALYGAAALACLQMYRWSRDWIAPAVVGLSALAWVAYLIPVAMRDSQLSDLFRSMDTKGGAEVARELGGLLIVIVWMIVLVGHSMWQRKRGLVDA